MVSIIFLVEISTVCVCLYIIRTAEYSAVGLDIFI